jgi:hypothetical protein
MNRMTPDYCPFLQRLINKMVPPEFAHIAKKMRKQEMLALSLREIILDVPGMQPYDHGGPSSRKHQSGPDKFFKSLWYMCKPSRDVSHQDLVLAQDTRRRQNELFEAKNFPCPIHGSKLDPVPSVLYHK